LHYRIYSINWGRCYLTYYCIPRTGVVGCGCSCGDEFVCIGTSTLDWSCSMTSATYSGHIWLTSTAYGLGSTHMDQRIHYRDSSQHNIFLNHCFTGWVGMGGQHADRTLTVRSVESRSAVDRFHPPLRDIIKEFLGEIGAVVEDSWCIIDDSCNECTFFRVPKRSAMLCM
jgi:hypothetical protein